MPHPLVAEPYRCQGAEAGHKYQPYNQADDDLCIIAVVDLQGVVDSFQRVSPGALGLRVPKIINTALALEFPSQSAPLPQFVNFLLLRLLRVWDIIGIQRHLVYRLEDP